MADDLSENQISLEELLEDVEFDCPGLTLNENSQDASVDTASQAQDSVDSADDTTKASDLPEHTFVKKMIAGKTGRMKGKNRITFTLFMGPHTYKWRFSYKENHYFSCTDCLKHKKNCKCYRPSRAW